MTDRIRNTIPKTVLYALIISYCAVLVVGIGSVLYANYVDNKSNHQWCEFLVTLDDGFSVNPPQTDFGKKFAAIVDKQRADFEC